MTGKKKFWGLVGRKERWGLTRRGWLAAILAALAAAVVVVLGIYPFLAITRTVPSSLLVVEGWLDESALKAAVQEFRTGGYEMVFTTGGPTASNPETGDLSDTYASVAASSLRRLGIPADRLQMVPCGTTERGRTFASAVALREHLRSRQQPVPALNIVTEGPHARRTRLAYERAFGDDTAIGIISVKGLEYDAEHWWRSSEGMKEVISESAAYLYSRLRG